MLIYAVVLLGILIFVHELGHFLTAKSVGVKVLKFSLGFGPRVIGRKAGETEYLISAFPLGGYVKMLGEDPEERFDEAERNRAFTCQPIWKRSLIVFSGPLFNLCFAVILFALIFLTGVPVPRPEIGRIDRDSPAANAGFRTGDRIVEISGKKTESWNDIDLVVQENQGAPLRFAVERQGARLTLTVTPIRTTTKNVFGEEQPVWDVGLSPLVPPTVGDVAKGSRAEKAGIRVRDRVLEIEGTLIETWQDMTETIHKSPEKPLLFKIRRGEQTFEISITPARERIETAEGKREIGLVGIKPEGNTFLKKHAVMESLILGTRKTWEIAALTLVSIVKLFQRVIPADTIGGPILIFQMAGQQASQGALNFFTFMALISINLGILNLLPIPVLDGGHLLFLSIEAVRKKPLSERAITIAQKVGIALLVTLMAFAFYNDIVRLLAGRTLNQ